MNFLHIKTERHCELNEAAKDVILKVACDRVGTLLKGEDIESRAQQISDLYESPAALVQQHWKGRKSRPPAQDWIQGIVEDVREENIERDKDRALYQFFRHIDLVEELLTLLVLYGTNRHTDDW